MHIRRHIRTLSHSSTQATGASGARPPLMSKDRRRQEEEDRRLARELHEQLNAAAEKPPQREPIDRAENRHSDAGRGAADYYMRADRACKSSASTSPQRRDSEPHHPTDDERLAWELQMEFIGAPTRKPPPTGTHGSSLFCVHCIRSFLVANRQSILVALCSSWYHIPRIASRKPAQSCISIMHSATLLNHAFDYTCMSRLHCAGDKPREKFVSRVIDGCV
jgi:hypothetical protein